MREISDHPVRIERSGDVAELILDRPERRNAITGPLVEGLLAGLEETRGDGTSRAVLPGGAGGVFCSGLRVMAVLLGRFPRSCFGAAQDAALESPG